MDDDADDNFSDDLLSEADDEEAQAVIQRFYMDEDRFGTMVWRNGDNMLRSKALHDEQRSDVKNVERLLRKAGMEDFAEYLASLKILPHFIWGRARFDHAHLWSTPEILKSALDDDDDAEEDEEDALREQASHAGSAAHSSTQGSVFTVAVVDDDWTDDEEESVVEPEDAVLVPEQEEANKDNMNYVDTVLDVFEGALEGLRESDAELAMARETRLKEGGSIASGGGGDRGAGGEPVLLQKRERQREMDMFRAVSLERRAEATHSVVLLLHDLGMPYYELSFAEAALELSHQAAEALAAVAAFDKEAAEAARAAEAKRAAREAKEAKLIERAAAKAAERSEEEEEEDDDDDEEEEEEEEEGEDDDEEQKDDEKEEDAETISKADDEEEEAEEEDQQEGVVADADEENDDEEEGEENAVADGEADEEEDNPDEEEQEDEEEAAEAEAEPTDEGEDEDAEENKEAEDVEEKGAPDREVKDEDVQESPVKAAEDEPKDPKEEPVDAPALPIEEPEQKDVIEGPEQQESADEEEEQKSARDDSDEAKRDDSKDEPKTDSDATPPEALDDDNREEEEKSSEIVQAEMKQPDATQMTAEEPEEEEEEKEVIPKLTAMQVRSLSMLARLRLDQGMLIAAEGIYTRLLLEGGAGGGKIAAAAVAETGTGSFEDDDEGKVENGEEEGSISREEWRAMLEEAPPTRLLVTEDAAGGLAPTAGDGDDGNDGNDAEEEDSDGDYVSQGSDDEETIQLRERQEAAAAAAEAEALARYFASALPPGWQQLVTDDGAYFYVNDVLGETTWERPLPAMPPGWREVFDRNTNASYYVNDREKGGVAQWDRPTVTTQDQWDELIKLAEPPQPPPLPLGWEGVIDDNTGAIFYVNDDLGITTWDRPVEEPAEAIGNGEDNEGGALELEDGNEDEEESGKKSTSKNLSVAFSVAVAATKFKKKRKKQTAKGKKRKSPRATDDEDEDEEEEEGSNNNSVATKEEGEEDEDQEGDDEDDEEDEEDEEEDDDDENDAEEEEQDEEEDSDEDESSSGSSSEEESEESYSEIPSGNYAATCDLELALEFGGLRLKQGRLRECKRVLRTIKALMEHRRAADDERRAATAMEAAKVAARRAFRAAEEERLDREARGIFEQKKPRREDEDEGGEKENEDNEADEDDGSRKKAPGKTDEEKEKESAEEEARAALFRPEDFYVEPPMDPTWLHVTQTFDVLSARLALAEEKPSKARRFAQPVFETLLRVNEEAVENAKRSGGADAGEMEGIEPTKDKDENDDDDDEEEEEPARAMGESLDARRAEALNVFGNGGWGGALGGGGGGGSEFDADDNTHDVNVGGSSLTLWHASTLLAAVDEKEGFPQDAAKLLGKAKSGFRASTLWWHRDSIDAFCQHARCAALVTDATRKLKIDELTATLNKQREDGAWLAAEETKAKVEELETTSGAAEAAGAIHELLEAVGEAVGPGHVNVGRCQVLLAAAVEGFPDSTWIRREKGSTVILDTIKADRLYTKAAALLSVSLGEDHPEAIAARCAHAVVLAERLNRREEADPLLAACLRESDAAMGRSCRWSVKLLEELAASRLAWAKDDPRKWLEDATRKNAELFSRLAQGRGNRHPATMRALGMLADVTALQGTKAAVAQAVALWRSCIGLRRRVQGRGHPDTVESVVSLCALLVKLDTPDSLAESRAEAQDAYDSCQRRHRGEPYHHSTLTAQRALAIANEGIWRAAQLVSE